MTLHVSVAHKLACMAIKLLRPPGGGGGGGGGGGTLIVSYIRRLGTFFWVQNLEFQYFRGFQKNKYFLGYEDFVDIFWGHHKIGLYLEVISMYFRVDS